MNHGGFHNWGYPYIIHVRIFPKNHPAFGALELQEISCRVTTSSVPRQSATARPHHFWSSSAGGWYPQGKRRSVDVENPMGKSMGFPIFWMSHAAAPTGAIIPPSQVPCHKQRLLHHTCGKKSTPRSNKFRDIMILYRASHRTEKNTIEKQKSEKNGGF